MTATNPSCLHRDHTAVFLADLQEKLMPVIWERDKVVQQAVSLVKAARILRLPVLITEHYPKGLGPTVPELLAVAGGFPIFEKTVFSGCTEEVMRWLGQGNIKGLLVGGVECHICVTQTALEALRQGLQVHVMSDATSSRTESNRAIGLQRMHDAGAILSSVEMALFELLKTSEVPEFKEILQIIK